MKTITSFILLLLAIGVITGCNKVNYRKTKSGLVYKLFPADNKDSLIKDGQVVKFQVTTKLNDSTMYSSYGKIPAFARLMATEKPPYNLLSVLPMMKKGDSAVIVQMIDSLIKMGAQLPGSAKKGDKITTTIRITDVFTNDSVAMIDYNKEMEKDKPRQMKEQEEEMAKMEKQKMEKQLKEDAELEKSGEMANEIKGIETYLSSKKINAQKTGKGTYVLIQQQGTGPLAAAGKYVNVKYTGRILSTDSTFQTNTYEFPLGKGSGVIRGWDEGLLLFSKGGKGVLFIPGFLAFGANPPQGSPFKPFEALKFDVELLNISDTPTVARTMR
jgi:FKBP-type peptidyl-prolyl cis-trans isomerase FkpA